MSTIKMEHKYFVILLAAAAMMISGVIYENTLSVLMPSEIIIDVAKVRKTIDEANLVPQEARYWQGVP